MKIIKVLMYRSTANGSEYRPIVDVAVTPSHHADTYATEHSMATIRLEDVILVL